jgi:hypothetical protein
VTACAPLPISDGYPEAWYLPNASDIPEGYTAQGTHYGSVEPAPPGAAWFEYPNDQRAGTLWYHDHALGITRLNVYAGMAGFWIIRDEVEDGLNLPGPAPRLGDAPDTKYYEIPSRSRMPFSGWLGGTDNRSSRRVHRALYA